MNKLLNNLLGMYKQAKLNKKAEEKESAKKDYTEQYAKVKEIMKEYGYGLSDGGYIYLISKEEPKDEGFQVKFKGDRLRVELDGKLKYSGYGPEAIEDFLKGMFYAKKFSSKNTKLTKKAGWKVLTPKDLTEEVKDEFLKDSIKEYAGHVKREDFYFVKGIKEKEDDQFSYEWEEGMFGSWSTNVKGETWYSLTDVDNWDYIYLIKEDKLYKMPKRDNLIDFGVVSSKRVKLRKKAKEYGISDYLNHFNYVQQYVLTENKGDLGKAVEDLLGFASSEYDKARFPREYVYKLVKEYIDDTIKFQEMIHHPIKEEYIIKAKELLNKYKIENKIANSIKTLHKKSGIFDVVEELAKKIVEDNKHAFSGHTDMAKLENNAYSMFLMDNASIKEILDEAKKIVSELDNDKNKNLEDADLYFGMKDRALLAEKVLEEKTKQEKQSSKTKATKKQAEKLIRANYQFSYDFDFQVDVLRGESIENIDEIQIQENAAKCARWFISEGYKKYFSKIQGCYYTVKDRKHIYEGSVWLTKEQLETFVNSSYIEKDGQELELVERIYPPVAKDIQFELKIFVIENIKHFEFASVEYPIGTMIKLKDGRTGKVKFVSNNETIQIEIIPEGVFNPRVENKKETIKVDDIDKKIAKRQNKLSKSATIKHENGVYNVYSESGKCLGKGYKTKEEAEKRLKQVEYFKNKKAEWTYRKPKQPKLYEEWCVTTIDDDMEEKWFKSEYAATQYFNKIKNKVKQFFHKVYDISNGEPEEIQVDILYDRDEDYSLEENASKKTKNKKKSLKSIVINKMATDLKEIPESVKKNILSDLVYVILTGKGSFAYKTVANKLKEILIDLGYGDKLKANADGSLPTMEIVELISKEPKAMELAGKFANIARINANKQMKVRKIAENEKIDWDHIWGIEYNGKKYMLQENMGTLYRFINMEHLQNQKVTDKSYITFNMMQIAKKTKEGKMLVIYDY